MDRFVSLRTKFVAFFSVILILTCSALSWFFIETRRASMTDSLNQLGTILLTSVVNNGQFRYGGLIAEDRETLRQFTESLIAVEDVVYVVIRGADHIILAQQNKIVKESLGSLTFSQERRFYPEEEIAERIYSNPPSAPLITPVALSEDKILVPTAGPSDSLWLLSSLTENLYDYAMPVLRRPATDPSLTPLPLELEERLHTKKDSPPRLVQGVVQIGISDARVKRAMFDVIRKVLLLTTLLIGAGILGAHLLTLRITTPLRSLAGVARQLAEGESPQPLPASSNDEVGQLTQMFNFMTRALQERNAAITANLHTIRRQISQLTTVHQTSAAITSTLDLNQLMDTVLQLLMSNLGFSRMLLMLKEEDRNVAYVAQVAGVSDEIADAARYLSIPIQDGDTFIAELFIRSKPVLVHDLGTVAHRMHPSILELARRVGVVSFALVPLQSHNQTLGFIGGDRGAQPCTEEDLNILVTIASHVATAIDNARTYAHLAKLTHNLEFLVQERTRELSVANERLQEHDHRRSQFFSVASHELRTPMTAIRSFADNMLDGVAGPLTDRQRMYLNRIGHNLNRLTRIINQLLDWSRLDLKKETLHLEPVCIGQIAGLVAENLRAVAEKQRLTITMSSPQQLPMILGDRDKLEQIFWNLIGNAVKFTPPEGRIAVELATTPENRVQARITDTGIGIPPDHLHKVFEEFSKVPSAMPTSQGAQLGLFITRSLVQMHQGTITVESALDSGTSFTLTFPSASLAREFPGRDARTDAPTARGEDS